MTCGHDTRVLPSGSLGTNNVVQNNIFAFNGRDCGYDNGGGKEGDPERNVDDYNCYYLAKPERLIRPGLHEILADPRFMDAQAGDYHIRDDSPCMGKAVEVKGRPGDLVKNVGAF
jgi:hypothetical protein